MALSSQALIYMYKYIKAAVSIPAPNFFYFSMPRSLIFILHLYGTPQRVFFLSFCSSFTHPDVENDNNNKNNNNDDDDDDGSCRDPTGSCITRINAYKWTRRNCKMKIAFGRMSRLLSTFEKEKKQRKTKPEKHSRSLQAAYDEWTSATFGD